MTITERQYQTLHIEQIIRLLGQYRKVCAQLPTGGGKTVEFSKLSFRFHQKTGKSVMILVHREELLYQTKRTIEKMFGIPVSIIVAGTKWVKFCPVYIGMVDSVYNRHELLPEVGLVIIDEAHNAIFNKLHMVFKEEYIIGFTATPKSSSKRQPMNMFYNAIAVGPQIKELIAQGHLCQNITRSPKDVVDKALLKIASTGDYDLVQMAEEFSKTRYVMNTYSAYFKFARNTKTIIYNVNIDHSLKVAECFNFCGVECKHLDGTTPKDERKAILEWFKVTPNAVLCNVNVATMGFDEPTIETVIVNRATTSMPLWLQMCGRGSRPIDFVWITENQKFYPYELSLKTNFTIIDMGANHVSHGDWSDDRDWNYIFNNPDVYVGGGLAPTKTCPDCLGVVHAATVVCPLDHPDGGKCFHVFDRKKYEEDKLLGEMLVVTKNINVDELVRFNKDKKTYFVFFEIGRKLIDALYNQGVEISDKKLELVYNKYMDIAKVWYEKTFPYGYFSEKFHRDLGKDNFLNYLKTKFQKTEQKQLVNA